MKEEVQGRGNYQILTFLCLGIDVADSLDDEEFRPYCFMVIPSRLFFIIFI